MPFGPHRAWRRRCTRGNGRPGQPRSCGASRRQVVVARLGPGAPEVAGRPVEDRRHPTEVFLDVEAIHDLDGIGEVFAGEVPDPGRPVAEDDLPGSPGRSRAGAPRARRAGRRPSRSRPCRASRRARWRPSRRPSPRPARARRLRRAPPRSRPCTASLRASWPSRRPACPAGPASSVLAHRHPRAIEAQVQRGRDLGRRRGHDLLAFVGGDRSKPSASAVRSTCFAVTGEPGQGAEELAALGEADQRRRRPHHARDGRGERSGLDHAEGAVAGTEPLGAGGAVVVGPRQGERPEGRA